LFTGNDLPQKTRKAVQQKKNKIFRAFLPLLWLNKGHLFRTKRQQIKRLAFSATRVKEVEK
jgi:hypothetical protein